MDQDLIEEEAVVSIDTILTNMAIRDMVKAHLNNHSEDVPETEEWEDDLPFHQGQIWVPPDTNIKIKLLQLYHDLPMAGHQGITGTEELTSRGYYWPGMSEFIEE